MGAPSLVLCGTEIQMKPEYTQAQISLVQEPDRVYIGIQRLGTVLDVMKRPGSLARAVMEMTGRASSI
jgi:hypothetical protein